jgi:hypothetical protein
MQPAGYAGADGDDDGEDTDEATVGEVSSETEQELVAA